MPFVDRLPETLHSGRLLIRVARPGDGAMLCEAIAESQADLAPWLGWVSRQPTLEEAESRCLAAHERFLRNEDLMAFFFTRNGGNLRSRRRAERAGFEYEGTLRKDRLALDGQLRNTRVYAIVR